MSHYIDWVTKHIPKKELCWPEMNGFVRTRPMAGAGREKGVRKLRLRRLKETKRIN